LLAAWAAAGVREGAVDFEGSGVHQVLEDGQGFRAGFGEALEGEGEVHEIAGEVRPGGANAGECGRTLVDDRSRDGGDGNRVDAAGEEIDHPADQQAVTSPAEHARLLAGGTLGMPNRQHRAYKGFESRGGWALLSAGLERVNEREGPMRLPTRELCERSRRLDAATFHLALGVVRASPVGQFGGEPGRE
jgi:hypothetical protein